jgi:Tfp pilus assembly protein PilX
MTKIIPKKTKAQRGIAMMVALLALVLLAAIGVGLMFMADTENSINNNYRDAQKAYFAARAGAEDVRVLLAPGGSLNGAANALSMPSNTSTAGVIYVKNPTSGETVDPKANGTYVDTELCQEQFSTLVNSGIAATTGPCAGLSTNYFTTPTVSSTDVPGLNNANALAFKWVRITNKQNYMGLLNQSVDGLATSNTAATAGQQVCWDGNKEIVTTATNPTCGSFTPSANPVWLLTSLAVTPKMGANPGSRRMVQMEVSLNPAIIPPGAIAAKAPVTLQGSFVLNAYDSCKSTCTYDKNGNATGCNGPYGYAVFTENTVSQTGGAGQTLSGAGTDPTTSPVSKLGVPDNQWPYNMDDLINSLKQTAQKANYTCTGTPSFYTVPPSYSDCGTQSSQTFYVGNPPQPVVFPPSMLLNPPVEPDPSTLLTVNEYIPGSVKLTSAAQGSGILIVDGDLEINGGLNWYGLILVRGKVSFTGGAGVSTNLYGAILAGEDITAINNGTTSIDGDKFGGSTNFHYDTCALNNNGGKRPPRLLATHELMF